MKGNMSEDILIKYLLEEANAVEKTETEAWVNADLKNAKKLADLRIILETSRKLAVSSPLNEEQAWSNFKVRKEKQTQDPVLLRPVQARYSWVKIAAAVLLVSAAGWMYSYLYHPGQDELNTLTLTSTDKFITDTLPDGSIVHLNKNSSITYAKNFSKHRNINLKGEAFFEVKHGIKSAFTVSVNDVIVKDIGTAFNVKANLGKTEVIVEQGIVEVSKAAKTIRLNENEMVNIKNGNEEMIVEKSPDHLYNYYRSKIFTANNTSLDRLVKVLNEAYGADIRIDNKTLSQIPITLTIRWDSPLADILEIIQETTPEIRIEKTGSIIHLR